MSNIATRPTGELAAAKKSAIDLLPAEWREPVRFFYGFHSDILKGALGIVTRLRSWIHNDALTLEEAVAVMRSMTRPDRCASYTYAGQLLADFAAETARVIAERRSREREALFKRESEAARVGTAPRDEFRRLVTDFGLETR